MHLLPTLSIGPWSVSTYALCVLLAFVVAAVIRRAEVRRLGYDRHPGHAWVGVGGLVGAMVGSKLGLLLFVPPSQVGDVLWDVLSADLTGKTVVGGIAGGYVAVEITKAVVGIRWSTGDGYALALPIGQAIGRLGCFLHGCCYGTAWEGRWAVHLHGAWRHPTQLYEVALDLLLAGLIWGLRGRSGPGGQLFRTYLVGYALIRFALDPWRADAALWWGPLTALQWFTLAVALGFGARIASRAGGASASVPL